MKINKSFGIGAIILTLMISGVVVAQDYSVNTDSEKKKLTEAFPQKQIIDDSCSTEDNGFSFSSCFFGKFSSALTERSKNLNTDLQPFLGENGAQVVGNFAVGMTGMMNFGAKVFSGATSNLTSLVKIDGFKKDL